MADRHRVVFVLTHPVQYFAPWFRFIHANVPDIDLRVFYAIQPSAAVQGAGFGTEFQWDQPLLDGYNSRVLPPRAGASGEQPVSAEAYSGLDAPALDTELIDAQPDFVVIPGWHAAVYRRAMRICRRYRVPALYRGDSNLSSGPASPLRRAAWRMRTRARLREYAAFLSVGVRSREYLEAFGAPEPLIFDSPHAVDNAHFARAHTAVDRRAVRQQFGLAPDRFTALFVGKLEPKKRPLDAIRAIRLLPSAQLLVVGSGPLDEACRAASAEAGGRVVFAGFLNQSALGAAYRAADCLVLPSDGRETWGLVVNEALAAGVPVVVSDRVGCQPDLVIEGETGGVFRFGDAEALTAALGHVQHLLGNGHDFAPRCRKQAEQHDFAAASKGLVEACETLGCRDRAVAANRGRRTQVLALCGHMVSPGGLERQTFEVLSTLRRGGAGVHALLNGWSSSRIVRLAEPAGVAWSIARSDEELTMRSYSPVGVARMLWEIAAASGNVMAAAWRYGTTDVLVPDFLMTIRAWPALVLLRASGRRIVLRVGMAPPQGRFYRRLWRTLVNSAVGRMVANSDFLLSEVRALGVPERKLGVIRNTVVQRSGQRPPSLARIRPSFRLHSTAMGESFGGHVGVAGRADRQAGRVVYVGQIIPGKGVDILIDAVAALRQDGVPATLDVVGDMAGWESPSYRGYRDDLRRRAAQAGLNGAVRFLGYREDVGAVMAAAAVHCSPSRAAIREGMANVVLEAKAAGLPSVVTRTGSLTELVEHQVDGWVADDSCTAIAEGLRYFLENDEKRIEAGAAARRSLERFSRDTFDRAWLMEFGVS